MATKHLKAITLSKRSIASLLAYDIAAGLESLSQRSDSVLAADALKMFDEAKGLMDSLAGVSEREYRRKHRLNARQSLQCQGQVVI